MNPPEKAPLLAARTIVPSPVLVIWNEPLRAFVKVRSPPARWFTSSGTLSATGVAIVWAAVPLTLRSAEAAVVSKVSDPVVAETVYWCEPSM